MRRPPQPWCRPSQARGFPKSSRALRSLVCLPTVATTTHPCGRRPAQGPLPIRGDACVNTGKPSRSTLTIGCMPGSRAEEGCRCAALRCAQRGSGRCLPTLRTRSTPSASCMGTCWWTLRSPPPWCAARRTMRTTLPQHACRAHHSRGMPSRQPETFRATPPGGRRALQARTTVAVTGLSAYVGDNVLPPTASLNLNFRCARAPRPRLASRGGRAARVASHSRRVRSHCVGRRRWPQAAARRRHHCGARVRAWARQRPKVSLTPRHRHPRAVCRRTHSAPHAPCQSSLWSTSNCACSSRATLTAQVRCTQAQRDGQAGAPGRVARPSAGHARHLAVRPPLCRHQAGHPGGLPRHQRHKAARGALPPDR